MIAATSIWFAGIICGLLLLLLLVPFRIKLQGWADVPDRAVFSICAAWGWGLVDIEKQAGKALRLGLFGFPVWQFSLHGAKKEKKKKIKPKKKSHIAMMTVTRNHLNAIMRVLGRLVKATFPRGYITGCIGLSDPADTADIALLNQFFQASWKYFQITVIPSFDEEVLQITIEAQVTVMIGWLGFTSILLLLQKQTRMMIYSLRHA